MSAEMGDMDGPGSGRMAATGSAVLDTMLVILLLAAVVISATTLVRGRDTTTTYVSGPRADVAHIIMNLAMAWMLTPWWSTAAVWITALVAGVTAAAFLALLVLRDRTSDERVSSGYHLLTAAVLVGAAVAMAPSGDHAAGGGLVGLWWVLAAVFAVDLLGTIAVAVVWPTRAVATPTPGLAESEGSSVVTLPPRTARQQAHDIRVAAVPHIAMDLAMVAMLIALAR